MQTLDSLMKKPTAADLRAQLLKQLQGVGFTSLTGFSPGTVTLTGVPTAEYDFRVTILTGGNLGAATFKYSTDGGVTTVATGVTVPSSGTYAVSGTTLTLAFTNAPDGVSAAFIAGDVYRVQTRQPTLPTTGWQTGSVPLSLVENDAAVLEDVYALHAAVAAGGLVDTSAGPWLDLLASNVYGLTRNAGVTTVGLVTLTDASSAGPFVLTDGQLWFASTSGLRFTNVGAATLPLGGTVTLTVRAERPGAAYNVGSGAISTMVVALPGVTVANPDPGTGTWVTVSGADTESDQSLRVRCKARWPSLGVGTPADAYALWARTADASITRTRVRVSPTVAGQVEVYLAGAAGAVSGTVVANANAYIQPRVPLCVTALVQSAAAVPVTVMATVYVQSAYLATAQAQAAANLTALFTGGVSNLGDVLPGIDIAGTVYTTAIIEQLMQAIGVRNVVMTTPAADVVLTATQVATLVQSLTFVGV